MRALADQPDASALAEVRARHRSRRVPCLCRVCRPGAHTVPVDYATPHLILSVQPRGESYALGALLGRPNDRGTALVERVDREDEPNLRAIGKVLAVVALVYVVAAIVVAVSR